MGHTWSTPRLVMAARRSGHPLAFHWYGTRRAGPARVIFCRICGTTIGSYSKRYFRPAAADLAIAEHGETHLA